MAVTYQQLGNDGTTNNNFTLRGNGDGTLSLCKGTVASPTEIVKIDASGNIVVGGLPIYPLGQCYLDYSGGYLVLSRLNGSYLFINGYNYQIPSAGVSLAGTGTSSGTFYYIYAYMNSGTMTLEFSATAYAVNSTYGHLTKSGDSTRSLVGIWYASGANTWSAIATEGASWFNPKGKRATAVNGNPSTTSTTVVQLSVADKASFVTFTGRLVRFHLHCKMTHDTATASMILGLGLGASTTEEFPYRHDVRISSTSQIYSFYKTHEKTYTEGRDYFSPLAYTSTGTFSFTDMTTTVAIWG